MSNRGGMDQRGAGTRWINWAGNVEAFAAEVARPGTADEVAEVVRRAARTRAKLRAVGSGHSFTETAATSGIRLEPDRLTGIVSVDRGTREVRVRAGTTLAALNADLAAHGLALPNLGDVDVQTVAGALATGTHGTGAGYGCLSTFVAALEFVTGTGELVRCSPAEHPDLFAAARVGLGALGVVTEVTLRCVDAFIRHADERPARLADVLAGLDELTATNQHFEFYWMPYTDRTLTKANNPVDEDSAPRGRFARWFNDDLLENTVIGAVCRLSRAVPRLTPTLLRTTARFFSPRVYTERSDLVFTSPRRVRFMEMEYGVPRAAIGEAFAGLRRVVEGLGHPVALPVEVRFTAADDIWLSHGYGRDSAYIAIHQFVGMPYEEYFRSFERVCSDLGGRPHWGKMHFRDASTLRPAYPRFDEFLAVRDACDPARVLANPYTERVLGP